MKTRTTTALYESVRKTKTKITTTTTTQVILGMIIIISAVMLRI